MFMNDDLRLQLEVYHSLEDYHNKALFIEKLLDYYKHTTYMSTNKTFCQSYWERELEELYYIGFRFF